MSPRDQTNLRQIVSESLELSGTEREAYLRQHCPSELLDEALELISYADDAEITRQLDQRLASAAAALSQPHSIDDMPLPVIEGFEILEPLGEGGMGMVFLARQTGALDRKVALKILRPGWASDGIDERFAVESRAIARVAHANIAAVYDAGTTSDGLAWFAMEFVDGKELRRYCDEEALTVRERLRLFLDLCHGVEHAHQRGIIHRDLKSSNILVETHKQSPIPKIIDFGIAKAIEGDSLGVTANTVVGQIIGTPEYMSPERLRGEQDVDTRCDVYSLGVILYELICGTLPFDRATTRRIGHSPEADTEAQRPSTRVSPADDVSTDVARARSSSVRNLRSQLRGELDWITLKALAQSAEDRYSSVLELRNDVENHLEGRAVMAGPASTQYRLRKFARRYRGALLTTAVVILSLAAGLVESNRQRLAAKSASQQAESVTAFLTGMLREVQPDVGDKDVTVRTVLDEAVSRLISDDAIEPKVTARLLMTIGSSYYALSRWDQALSAYTRADSLYRRTLGPKSLESLDARNDMARVYQELQRFDDAERELLAVRTALTSRLGPEALEVLAVDHDLGNLYLAASRPEEAVAAYRHELEISRRTTGEGSTETARSMGGLGNALLDLGENEEASEFMGREIAILKRLHGELHPALLTPYNNMVFARFGQGRFAEAESLMSLVLDLRTKILGEEHADTITSEINLAWLQEHNGNVSGARSLLEDALRLSTLHFAPDSDLRLTAMNNLAFLLLDKVGEYTRAESLLEEVIDIRTRVLGPTHINTLTSRNNLALLYEKTNRLKQAEDLDAELLELRRETLGEDHPHTKISRENLARVRAARQ